MAWRSAILNKSAGLYLGPGLPFNKGSVALQCSISAKAGLAEVVIIQRKLELSSSSEHASPDWSAGVVCHAAKVEASNWDVREAKNSLKTGRRRVGKGGGV